VETTHISPKEGNNMVYLVRYACHFGAEASEGVYLLDHEPLIVGQLKPRSTAACVGIVHHVLYI